MTNIPLHPGLTLINIKFFLDASRLKNLSLVAKNNFVTQSAVSQGIMKLEQALGIDLTNHNRNQFALTDEGEVAAKYIQKLFNILEEMQERIKEESDLPITLNFGCPISIGRIFLAPLIHQIRKNKKINLNPLVSDFETLLALVKKNEIEFAIAINDNQLQEFDTFSIYSGNFAIFSLKENFDEGIYVDNSKNPYVQTLSKIYEKKHKKPFQILGETNSWELIYDFIEKDIGAGFLPDFLLLNQKNKNIKKCKATLPTIPYDIVAFFPKGKRLSKQSQEILKVFKEISKGLINKKIVDLK